MATKAISEEKKEDEDPSASRHDSYCQYTSIFLCISVVALSTGVPYMLKKYPLFLELWLGSHSKASVQHDTLRYPLLWMAPFFSGGGYCSEAISYITAIEPRVSKLAIRQHGDAENINFWKGLPSPTRQTLVSLAASRVQLTNAVVVCHSEPGAWHPPLYMTPPCPPTGYKQPRYIIGRTMFETDSVTPHHVQRCNKMEEVWVPTQFHIDTFTKAGVQPHKLVKLVQPVDTRFFNPSNTQPLKLPINNRLFGEKAPTSNTFVFLSIFKFEHRKGWDILLSAYLRAFSATDDVALYLLTNAYHSGRDFATVISEFVASRSIQGALPSVYLIDEHVLQSELPGLYKAANCFVLPSRGEGWGRPHVEAMAMGLPVIATNWSGMTEYMTEENSYPLQVEKMVRVVDGPFKGHLWAEPSITHLKVLMRHVVSEREEGRKKAKAARADMVAKYSQEVVASIVVEQLVRIQAKLDSRSNSSTSTTR